MILNSLALNAPSWSLPPPPGPLWLLALHHPPFVFIYKLIKNEVKWPKCRHRHRRRRQNNDASASAPRSTLDATLTRPHWPKISNTHVPRPHDILATTWQQTPSRNASWLSYLWIGAGAETSCSRWGSMQSYAARGCRQAAPSYGKAGAICIIICYSLINKCVSSTLGRSSSPKPFVGITTCEPANYNSWSHKLE